MSVLRFKKANCRDCYKCVRNCPVKAIQVQNHQAQILDEDCVLCGRCINVCPQNAKEVRVDLDRVKNAILSGKRVLATVAPSYLAAFPVSSFLPFSRLLTQLGFAGAEETAAGAYQVKTAYEELVRSGKQPVIISSCCHTVIRLAQRYCPEALPLLAPVITPMQAHAAQLKQQHPDAVVVFIGPCISKKDEIAFPGSPTDIAITFEELWDWMAQEGLSFPEADVQDSSDAGKLSRLFPMSGGILNTMEKEPGWHYTEVSGVENCLRALKEAAEGKLNRCFIEMSACAGSCVNGPALGDRSLSTLSARMKVEKAAGDCYADDFNKTAEGSLQKTMDGAYAGINEPSDAEIEDILHRMGKYTPEDELNCSACGYATCREKARAVFLGRAEIEMCLPYMKKRAEGLSDRIIGATPNAILTVDQQLRIQQINQSALELFEIKPGSPAAQSAIGAPVSRLMDEFDFVQAIAQQTSMEQKQVRLNRYGKYVNRIMMYDRENSLVICIMKDVTRSVLRHDQIVQKKNNTVKITNEIVEKQLRIVQEIASLLGETAAETKIALTDLRDVILEEEDEEA